MANVMAYCSFWHKEHAVYKIQECLAVSVKLLCVRCNLIRYKNITRGSIKYMSYLKTQENAMCFNWITVVCINNYRVGVNSPSNEIKQIEKK